LIATLAQVKPAWALAHGAAFPRLRGIFDACGSPHTGLLDLEEVAAYTPIDSSVPVPMGAGCLAYVFFTSGSTGVPKGIAGQITALDPFIRWEAGALGLTRGIRVAQLPPPVFDPFLRDIFLPLSLGGLICIPSSPEVFS